MKKNLESPQTRSKYEDPGNQFSAWVGQTVTSKTWYRRIFSHLEERYQIRRLTGVFCFCLFLSYLVFLQIEVPYDFKVGDVAKTDVISTLNFEMTDEVTTEEKRLKAEASVPLIYDFDGAAYEKIATGVFRAFRQMRNILRDNNLKPNDSIRLERLREFTKNKAMFEQLFGASIPDHLFEWLVENHFNSRIESVLLRNLERWYDKKIADSPDRFIPISQNFILIRVIQKNNRGKEFNFNKSDIIDVQNPGNFDLEFRKSDNLDEMDRSHASFLTRSLIIPNLTLNKQETALRKQTARDAVLPVTITIKKGQTIISRNSVVQPFQMAIIKQIESIQNDRRKDFMVVSLAALLCVCLIVFQSYLGRFRNRRFRIESKDLYVMMLILTSVVVIIKLFLFVTEAAFVSKFANFFSSGVFLFAAPIAAGPMLVGLLISSGEIVWLFTAFLSFCLGVMVDFNLPLTLITMVGGVAGARGVYKCKTRNDIYFAGLRTGAVNAALIFTVLLITKSEQDAMYRDVFLSMCFGFIGGLLSSFVAMIYIPVLESLFNYTTDVKLLELSNLNHPLLKEMIVRAPGTYHHSMMVGSMVEAAAEEIGANPLLGKVMCYYHDIGKIEHAQYFIENQKPGQNPHDNISPFMSKTLLIAHVKDGVERGMVHKLGKPIIDGILQHHGTTVISYFHNKALDQHKDGEADVSEEEFRYPGPKPQFREAALCMLADSIEAAARSLDEPTPTRLQNIVRNVIQRKFTDGQLDECNLTLKDISKVETSFVRILLGIYHQRIDYPRRAGGGMSESPAPSVVASSAGNGPSSSSHSSGNQSPPAAGTQLNQNSTPVPTSTNGSNVKKFPSPKES